MPQNSPAGIWEPRPCQLRLPLPVAVTEFPNPPSAQFCLRPNCLAALPCTHRCLPFSAHVCLSFSAPACLYVILYKCLSVWCAGHPASLGLPAEPEPAAPAAPTVVWVSGWLCAEGRGLTLPPPASPHLRDDPRCGPELLKPRSRYTALLKPGRRAA